MPGAGGGASCRSSEQGGKWKHPSQPERLGLRQTLEFTVTSGPGGAEPGRGAAAVNPRRPLVGAPGTGSVGQGPALMGPGLTRFLSKRRGALLWARS